MKQDLVPVAGGVLEEIARDWRELVAGSEGFLTGEKYCGLHRHNVVWGEMVSFTYIMCYFLRPFPFSFPRAR